MARLPRLAAPGLPHLVLQRSHGGRPAFRDAEDLAAWRQALAEAARSEHVALHAWALAPDRSWLLLTPADAASPGRLLQHLGRRYVGAYNRRHGCSGPLWDGRFRAAVVEPGAWRLDALLLVDAAAPDSSAPHRTGRRAEPDLVDTPEYWALGNTPFEREAAWRLLLEDGLPAPRQAALERAARGSWAVGSSSFLEGLQTRLERAVRPRPAGRPPASPR